MRVYISQRIFSEALEMLRKEGITFEMNEGARLSKEGLIKKIQEADGLICLLSDGIDSEVLKSNPKLKVVCNVAVGYDNIDVGAATKLKIMVTNTPGVLTETTADLAFALLLSVARRIVEADKFTRRGEYKGWELIQPHLGRDVYGKALGIVGMGRIGTAVAKRASRGFDMKILYYDEIRNEQAEKELGAEFVEFEELLEKSDFISIHSPLTEKTRHMFSTEQFKKMKKSAYLINTARGPVVNEEALVKALRDKEIKGAGLDVYEEEPKVHPELVKLDNVVLLPHIASASVETRTKMATMAAENMIAALKGKEPPNLVNKEVLKGGQER
ncbi:MAG: putative 2-hydroxyacid dehydrogenase [Dehalococcoidia bacterium]|nr:putative 2-hydroxyacid dehydrogenase [Bacillota bacterium]